MDARDIYATKQRQRGREAVPTMYGTHTLLGGAGRPDEVVVRAPTGALGTARGAGRGRACGMGLV